MDKKKEMVREDDKVEVVKLNPTIKRVGQPEADRQEGDKPEGDKPEASKSEGDKPEASKSEGDKPEGDQPKAGKDSLGAKVKSKAIRGCLFLFLILLLIVSLMVLGGFIWNEAQPKIVDWLEGRGIYFEPKEKIVNTSERIEYRTEENTVIKITSEENTIITVVEENMSSVVSIAINQDEFSPSEGEVNGLSQIGSGFIVDKNGLIMTNEHVVSDRTAKYSVVTSDGKQYEVKDIAHDDVNDVAILKIEAENLKAVTLGNSDDLLQGQLVIAIGTPLGEFAGSVTTGVVSGLNRSVSTGTGSFTGVVKTFESVIQTDAAINPGNSGGPLLNSAGEVIGINFATTNGADNISFALPINFAKQRLEEYITFGKFLKPYIGIEYQIIDPATAQYYDDIVPGAFVRRVIDDSPASKAGIKRDDIITKINDEEVMGSFVALIQKNKIGDKVKLEVFRNGEMIDIEVVLGESN